MNAKLIAQKCQEASKLAREILKSSDDSTRQNSTGEQSMYEWLVENGQAVDDAERTSL